MRPFFLLVFLFPLLQYSAEAQYVRWNDIPVKEPGKNLRLAFAGGIKNPQFSTMDLNKDGLQDLFVFEQSGGITNVFINNGSTTDLCYEHAPEYNSQFPTLSSWALLRDYNGDGQEDIFHYTGGSVGVYTSNYNDGQWTFELSKEKLKFQGISGELSVYVSAIDIPAIVDVNNDGDMDILTFNSNGGYLEYFENYSQELYGHSDSLVYERLSRCWGEFLEDNTGADVALYESCTGSQVLPNLGIRHAGSSILAFDPDEDGDLDLLLGDVSHPSILHLENGSGSEFALMTSKALFPDTSQGVDIYLFPATYELDTDNDGQKDILASCKEGVFASNFQDCWRYKRENGNYTLVEEDFLGGDMIDVGEASYPVFVDYNNDNVQDLIIGNYGYFDRSDTFYNSMLALYENVGTQEMPSYQLIDRDFSSLSQYEIFGIYPAFEDLDGDGDMDMMAGSSNGYLHYFENTAAIGEDMLLEPKYLSYYNVPNVSYSAPVFHDIDEDGKPDMIIGERQGSLVLLQNNSDADTLSFEYTGIRWGKVDVRQNGYPYGFAAPAIFEEDGETQLLINTFIGNVFHYKDLHLDSFTLVTRHFANIAEGGQGGISSCKIDEQHWAFAVGNKRGGIAMFKQDDSSSASQVLDTHQQTLVCHPNPAGDLLQVQIKEQDQLLRIFDLMGCELQSHTLNKESAANSTLQVDLSALAKGVYILELSAKHSKRSTRFIKIGP